MGSEISQASPYEPYLAFALELVEATGEILRKYYYDTYQGHALKIESKSDGSPVTQPDREIESLISKRIRERFPQHSIWGEEFGKTGAQSDSEFLWVIDPIDGTRSFLSGNPLFGTLIALLYKERPILGVMDLPILEQRYWGVHQQPTFLKNRSLCRQLHTRPCRQLSDALGRTTSLDLFVKTTDKDAFCRLKEELGLMLYGGDCFCYAQLAAGLVDLVMETGLAPYDFLALVPIIEGAGGQISTWQGLPLSLHSSRESVLACGDPHIHQLALEYIHNV